MCKGFPPTCHLNLQQARYITYYTYTDVLRGRQIMHD